MNLTQYITKEGGRPVLLDPVLAALAKRAQCSTGTLYMIVKGHKVVGPKLAGRLELATSGKVTRLDLRPDLFGKPRKRAA